MECEKKSYYIHIRRRYALDTLAHAERERGTLTRDSQARHMRMGAMGGDTAHCTLLTVATLGALQGEVRAYCVG